MSLSMFMLSAASRVPCSILHISTAVEAGFYRLLRIPKEELSFKSLNPSITYLVQRGAVIQWLFNVINGGHALVYLASINSALVHRYNFSFLPKSGYLINLKCSFALACVFIFPVYTALAYRLTEKQDNKFSETPPYFQVVGQSMLITQIVLNALLFCVSANRLLLTINLVCSLYALWAQSMVKWIKASQTIQCAVHRPGEHNYAEPLGDYCKMTLHFNFLATHIKKTDECSVCLAKELAERVSFCGAHFFDKECLGGLFTTVTKSVGEKNSLLVRFGSPRNYSYTLRILESALPTCPLCRGAPSHYVFEAAIPSADVMAAIEMVDNSEE